MKRVSKWIAVSLCLLVFCIGCAKKQENNNQATIDALWKDSVKIELSDDKIMADGVEISTDEEADVYIANDIVYYEENKDFTYGEGEKADEHSKEEADKHTVLHITKAGNYALSGKLSYGQIAIDLGEDSIEDESAVVNLILNNVDINCDVAPAVIFYNVYECGDDDADKATKDVDTAGAGANVYIADGTVNNIKGSHVAKIYKSVELSEDGTSVVDSKKLHKYDGAFYSKRSMNIYGGEKDSGVLNILADNEGLDSEMHLTIHGGNINIESGNDGINTNEDEISVTTINGGVLSILVNGSTGEGDGIDSNGWLVINGGTVIAEACSISGDAGIDSDMGIHINGGTVIATGNMLDRIGQSDVPYTVYTFKNKQSKNNLYELRNDKNKAILEFTNTNEFTYLILADENLREGSYSLWCNDTLSEGAEQKEMGGRGPKKPEGMEMPEMGKRPESMEVPEMGERPEGMEPPQMGERPEGMEPPTK